MQQAHATINQVLVTLFNHILRIEERTLDTPGLSIREIHVLEAVCQAQEARISTLAQAQHVTMGSMSVAISTLERKGYLAREQSQKDRRVTYIRPSEKALAIQEKHEAFHRDMVNAVVAQLTDEELAILVKALQGVDSYFYGQEESPT